MGNSCEWIPSKGNEKSILFEDLQQVVGDRSKTRELYSYLVQPEIQKLLDIKEFDKLGEPTIKAAMTAIANPELFLGKKEFINYLLKTENLNTEYKDFTEAVSRVDSLRGKYRNHAFSVSQNGDSFIITPSNKSVGHNNMRDTFFKNDLQNRLLNYMRSLGFDVERNSTIDNAARFSPLNAEENAKGLKKVIQLKKGALSEEAFVEEFSHFIIEGLHAHPIVERLLNSIDNDTVKTILEDSYERYKALYSENEDLLKKEAAGKILTEAFFKNEGTDSQKYLSNRIFNTAIDRISKGNATEIDKMISNALDTANELVGNLDSSDTIVYFDKKAINDASTLYSTSKEVKSLQKKAEQAYQIMTKKIKISYSRNKRKSDFSEENKAIEAIKAKMDKKDYAGSCFSFLNFAIDDLKKNYDQIKSFNVEYEKSNDISLPQLKKVFKMIRNAQVSLSAYQDIIRDLSAIREMEGINEDLLEEDIQSIEEKSTEVLQLFNSITHIYKNARYNSIFKFFQYFWGDDKIIKSMNGKEQYTLEDVLNMIPADVSGVSRLFNSMEDSSSALLTIVDSIFKKVNHKRDAITIQYRQELNAIHDRLVKDTGSRDTSFMFEKDSDGNLTGMIVSNIDHAKYYQERRDAIKKWKEDGKSNIEIADYLRNWEMDHTETIPVNGRKERVPKKELYPSNGYNNLTDAQKRYWDSVMKIKDDLDSKLQSKYQHRYRAVQKRASKGEALANNITDPKKAIAQIWGDIKSDWIAVSDDTQYGETIDDEGNIIDNARKRQLLLDFAGNPVSKVPIYYTARLEDMSYLSTSFTDSMVSYAAMTINYDQLNKIADAMEVLKGYVNDMRVQQNAGSTKLYEKFGLNGQKFSGEYTKSGLESEVGKQLAIYLDTNLYGRKKKEEKIYVNGKEINYGKALDNLRFYKTLVGMGYNMFSNVSNVSMGSVQLLEEAMGNEVSKNGFRVKDLAKGVATYFKMLPGYVINYFNDVKMDKLSLLINKFDPIEEVRGEMSEGNLNKGRSRRALAFFDPLQGMAIGEHYLHCVPLLATLNSKKVTINNKQVSLLDAIEVKKTTGPTGNDIYNIEFKDGSEITEEDVYNLKREVQASNHRTAGAYSGIDKGQAGRYVMFRMMMQYRQWMPAFIMNRFKSSRYNDASGMTEEGFYISAFKFLTGSLKDIRHLKFNIATNWNKLSDHQKGNCMKAITEATMFYLLALLLKHSGVPDDDDSDILNFGKLIAFRTKMELGAAFPLNKEFPNNIKTLINSPIPAMEGLDSLAGMFNIFNMFNTIENGKYKGWSKWERDTLYAVPFVRNITRLKDLNDGNFDMFNVYLNN